MCCPIDIQGECEPPPPTGVIEAQVNNDEPAPPAEVVDVQANDDEPVPSTKLVEVQENNNKGQCESALPPKVDEVQEIDDEYGVQVCGRIFTRLDLFRLYFFGTILGVIGAVILMGISLERGYPHTVTRLGTIVGLFIFVVGVLGIAACIGLNCYAKIQECELVSGFWKARITCAFNRIKLTSGFRNARITSAFNRILYMSGSSPPDLSFPPADESDCLPLWEQDSWACPQDSLDPENI